MGAPMEQRVYDKAYEKGYEAANMAEDIIINVPPPQPQPDRLDKILDYLTNAPTEVQIVAIIGIVLIFALFLRSDWSNFLTKHLTKQKK